MVSSIARYNRRTTSLAGADGTAIAYHTHARSGGGAHAGQPALILTNGIGTTENFWRHVVDDLARDHHVVHWDYRGHGASEIGKTDDYSMRVLADDLHRVTSQVMAECNGAPPVHVGFSMGVSVLTELYRAHPEQVRAMAFVAGSPDAPGTGTLLLRAPGAMASLRSLMAALSPGVPLAGAALKRVMRSRMVYRLAVRLRAVEPQAPREDIDEFLDGLSRMDASSYWKTLRALMAANASDVLPSITVPVLILAAERDLVMPLSQMRRLRTALPAARYVEIPNTGHAALVEEGPELAKHIRWLCER